MPIYLTFALTQHKLVKEIQQIKNNLLPLRWF